MPRLRVTDIKPGENHSAIVNFRNPSSLVLTPHLLWHSRQRKWNEPWWMHPEEPKIIGLEEVKFIVDGKIVVELQCQPAHRIVKLVHGYRQSHAAHAWEAALDYLSLEGVFPAQHLVDVVLTDPDL